MGNPAKQEPMMRRLLAAASGLAEVSSREIPGGTGLFAQAALFALVTPEQRIAVRIPDASIFTAMLKTPGLEAFHPRGAESHDWLLLPSSEIERPSELATIVACAHGLAVGAEPPPRATHVRPRAKGHTTSSETPTAKRKTRISSRVPPPAKVPAIPNVGKRTRSS